MEVILFRWQMLKMQEKRQYAPINSSTPSVAYMRHWIESAFAQIMACRLATI